MRSALILVVLGAMLVPTALHAADYCDDKIEPGESPDGKAMAIMSSIMTLALAERYCSAPPTPLSHTVIVVEEAHGCGPRARLEADYGKRVGKEEGAERAEIDALIREIVAGEKDAPQAEVDRRAKAAIEAEFGGCSELLRLQRDLEERYRNPPRWPPEPDK